MNYYGQKGDDPVRMLMMRQIYAVVWYELCVALALRDGYVASFAGHSARGAHLYRVPELDRSQQAHVVYHFTKQRLFSCTCQPVGARHLPCAHVGAAILLLQATIKSPPG